MAMATIIVIIVQPKPNHGRPPMLPTAKAPQWANNTSKQPYRPRQPNAFKYHLLSLSLERHAEPFDTIGSFGDGRHPLRVDYEIAEHVGQVTAGRRLVLGATEILKLNH